MEQKFERALHLFQSASLAESLELFYEGIFNDSSNKVQCYIGWILCNLLLLETPNPNCVSVIQRVLGANDDSMPYVKIVTAFFRACSGELAALQNLLTANEQIYQMEHAFLPAVELLPYKTLVARMRQLSSRYETLSVKKVMAVLPDLDNLPAFLERAVSTGDLPPHVGIVGDYVIFQVPPARTLRSFEFSIAKQLEQSSKLHLALKSTKKSTIDRKGVLELDEDRFKSFARSMKHEESLAA
jgi:hypothetical protein